MSQPILDTLHEDQSAALNAAINQVIPAWCAGVDSRFWRSGVGAELMREYFWIHQRELMPFVEACRTLFHEDTLLARKRTRTIASRVFSKPNMRIGKGRYYLLRHEIENLTRKQLRLR